MDITITIKDNQMPLVLRAYGVEEQDMLGKVVEQSKRIDTLFSIIKERVYAPVLSYKKDLAAQSVSVSTEMNVTLT